MVIETILIDGLQDGGNVLTRSDYARFVGSAQEARAYQRTTDGNDDDHHHEFNLGKAASTVHDRTAGAHQTIWHMKDFL